MACMRCLNPLVDGLSSFEVLEGEAVIQAGELCEPCQEIIGNDPALKLRKAPAATAEPEPAPDAGETTELEASEADEPSPRRRSR